MTILIWLGAGVTLCGVALLVWCIVKLVGVRRAGHDEATLRAAMQRLVPLNTGALFLSVLGLMLVVLGIILS
ncbi:MAG: hypothetical protein AAF678_06100 [Pseudomonadota bacterium]